MKRVICSSNNTSVITPDKLEVGDVIKPNLGTSTWTVATIGKRGSSYLVEYTSDDDKYGKLRSIQYGPDDEIKVVSCTNVTCSNSIDRTSRFQIGKTYQASGLYGDTSYYKVVARTDPNRETQGRITMQISHYSEDDGSYVDDGTEVFYIEITDLWDNRYDNVIGKQECIEIWEYHGHSGYLFAERG